MLVYFVVFISVVLDNDKGWLFSFLLLVIIICMFIDFKVLMCCNVCSVFNIMILLFFMLVMFGFLMVLLLM